MPAQIIDPSTGDSVGSYVVRDSLRDGVHIAHLVKSWGSECDSFYEYLIKYPRLTNTDDNSYADAWLTAVDTSIKTLLKVRC